MSSPGEYQFWNAIAQAGVAVVCLVIVLLYVGKYLIPRFFKQIEDLVRDFRAESEENRKVFREGLEALRKERVS